MWCCQASCNGLSDCTSDPSATSCRGGPSIKTLLVLPYCITAVLTHFVTCRLGHPHYRRKCRQNSRVIHCRNRRRFLCGQPWKRSTQHHNLRSARCGRCMYRGGWPVAMARLHIGGLCASVNDILHLLQVTFKRKAQSYISGVVNARSAQSQLSNNSLSLLNPNTY